MNAQRILFIRWSWFCDDVIECMEQAGLLVFVVERDQSNFPQHVTQMISDHRPDVLFSLNFNPLFAEIAHKNNLRAYIAWNIDNLVSSAFCKPDHIYPETLLYCIDRPSMDVYRRNNYPNVFYLPIGTRTDRFSAKNTDDSFLYDVSFVGCSMIKQGNEFPGLVEKYKRLAASAKTNVDRQGNQLVADALTVTVQEAQAHFFQPQIQQRLDQLSKKLGFDLTEVIWHDPAFFHIVLAKEVSAQKRIALIKAAAQICDVHVFGDPEWKQILQKGIHCHGKADYRTQTPNIYRHSKINLNIEKTYNTSSINLRMIDAMVAGGFVLTEPVDDLPDHFVSGQDLVTYSSVSDMQDKIRYYLDHEEERKRIAENGRQAALKSFALGSRIQEMLKNTTYRK